MFYLQSIIYPALTGGKNPTDKSFLYGGWGVRNTTGGRIYDIAGRSTINDSLLETEKEPIAYCAVTEIYIFYRSDSWTGDGNGIAFY